MIKYLTPSKSLIETRPELDSKYKFERQYSVFILDSIPKITLNTHTQLVLSLSLSDSATSQSSSSTSLNNSKEEIKKKQIKKRKWKNASVDLINFTVKRSTDNNLYFLNELIESRNDSDNDEQAFDFDNITNEREENDKLQQKIEKNLRKNISLKKLLKTNQLKSVNNFDFLNGKNCFKKRKNTKQLYFKYNLYEKIQISMYNLFINKLNRSKYLYAINRIDKRHKLDHEMIIESKKIFKSIKLCEKLLKPINENDNFYNQTDPPIVVNYSIDHSRLNEELNQNYDQVYLEFLISLQHRDITPEDYEYLSRLDELIKKKTLNENILNSLETEYVDENLLNEINNQQEVCGICLDSYLIDQYRKKLPCGHKFHLDCIDNWLKSHSTTCPLDNLSIESINNKNDKEDTNYLLNEENSNLLNNQEDLCILDLFNEENMCNENEIMNLINEMIIKVDCMSH